MRGEWWQLRWKSMALLVVILLFLESAYCAHKNKHVQVLDTPVVLFMYKRPEMIKQSFEAIAKVKPKKLFLISDGPKGSEKNLIEECRKIVKNISWDCQVFRNFSAKNLGCGTRIITGLAWVFSFVDRAIIIEDDIIASEEFFCYCQELLETYKDDVRIASISGCNLGYNEPNKYAYRFTHFMNMWGWATWKRVFDRVDFCMRSWPTFRRSEYFTRLFGEDTESRLCWTKFFNGAYYGRIDTWDFHWMLSDFGCGALNISPTVNLVRNVGFNKQATHTKHETFLSHLATSNLEVPLRHPLIVEADQAVDAYIIKVMTLLSHNDVQLVIEGEK